MKLKNKSRLSSILFIVTLVAGVSCQTDLLNPVPKTTFSDLVVFDTPARIELQVNGLYSSTKSGNFLGGRTQIYGDIRSEDFINRTSNGVTGYPVWNHTLVETDQNATINLWNAAYAAVNQCNVFIQGMSDNAAKFVPPTFPAGYTTVANNYVAEARFIRAVCYYYLLQYYARPFADGAGSKPGLPLRLKAEKSSLNNDLARSTVAEIYTQITSDLDFAEQNLPLDYATGGTIPQATLRNTRAHRNTAIAFKTRVYLSMGNYASVITEANKIVPASAPFVASSGVAHALSGTIAAVFATPQETLESIFSFPFTSQNPPGTQNQLGFYYSSQTDGQAGGGEYSLNNAAGTGIITNTVDWVATDARRAFNVASPGSGGAIFLRKYTSPTPYTDKAPVIRYAEVLLNLAEAKVRSTNTVDAQAVALLNAVHGRSDAVSPPFTVGGFASATALSDRILLEKRIEFLGEGLRNYDLMRLLAPIPGKSSISAVPQTDTRYIWPIPSSELAANTLMTRN